MIFPSLLEYSVESLQQKLDLLDQHRKYVSSLQSADILSLHLDFVLPQFAKDRSVMTSLKPHTVLENLNHKYRKSRINLTIHLMGELEDMLESFAYFDQHDFNTKWKYTVLLPEKFVSNWRSQIKKSQKNVVFGVWYDLGECKDKSFKIAQTYLLMTVLAGKSGQQLTQSIKETTKKLTLDFPNVHFILDGGWQIGEKSGKNVDIVSHSSFWKSLGEIN